MFAISPADPMDLGPVLLDLQRTNSYEWEYVLRFGGEVFCPEMSHCEVLEMYYLINKLARQEYISKSQVGSPTTRYLRELKICAKFKDHQESLMMFLGSGVCSQLEALDYQAAGSSLAIILLSPSTSQGEEDAPHISRNKIQLNQITTELIDQRAPFCRTLKSLQLGFNADASQGKTDIRVFNKLLQYMPLLQEFSMAQPLDDLSLFRDLTEVEGGKSKSKLGKITITLNNECGMDTEEAENQLRAMLPRLEEIEVDIDDRESCFYLNQSRDRKFQAFLRRFRGKRG